MEKCQRLKQSSYFLLISLNSTPAYAYIEPGIISMFLQAVIATVVGFLYM